MSRFQGPRGLQASPWGAFGPFGDFGVFFGFFAHPNPPGPALLRCLCASVSVCFCLSLSVSLCFAPYGCPSAGLSVCPSVRLFVPLSGRLSVYRYAGGQIGNLCMYGGIYIYMLTPPVDRPCPCDSVLLAGDAAEILYLNTSHTTIIRKVKPLQ